MSSKKISIPGFEEFYVNYKIVDAEPENGILYDYKEAISIDYAVFWDEEGEFLLSSNDEATIEYYFKLENPSFNLWEKISEQMAE